MRTVWWLLALVNVFTFGLNIGSGGWGWWVSLTGLTIAVVGGIVDRMLSGERAA